MQMPPRDYHGHLHCLSTPSTTSGGAGRRATRNRSRDRGLGFNPGLIVCIAWFSGFETWTHQDLHQHLLSLLPSRIFKARVGQGRL